MSAKHTPGPWKKRKGFDSDTIEVFAPNPKIKRPFYPTALAVVDSEEKEGKANARLIAASPCLLSALVGLLDCISETRGKDARDAVCAAKAAIAKATGEGEA